MTLSERQRIFTRNVGCLIEYAYSIGIELTFGEAHRTTSQGLLNYHGYEVRPSRDGGIELLKSRKLSNTLQSLHLDRLAVDFNFFIEGKLTYDFEKVKPLGDYWESLHPKNRWGGDFNGNDKPDGFIDTPHFEMQK